MPGLFFSFVRAGLERWLFEGFLSQMLSTAFLGVSTKRPGCSTQCSYHDRLELKCLPGPCGPWLLFHSQHPGSCSFPGNSLWPSLQESHFVHTQVSVWPKIQGDSDVDLGSTQHSSLFSGALPHKFQPLECCVILLFCSSGRLSHLHGLCFPRRSESFFRKKAGVVMWFTSFVSLSEPT